MRASYDTTPQSLSHLASPGLYTPPVGRGEGGGGGAFNPPARGGGGGGGGGVYTILP